MMRSAFLILVISLVGGCSVTGQPSPATPSPLPTPSPTMGLAQIGAKYLAIAATLNKANCSANAVFANAKSTLPQLKKATATLATALRTAADGLKKLPWPSEIAPDAKALIKILAAMEAAYVLVAADKTRNDAIASLNDAYTVSKPASAAANLLRGDL